MSAGAGRFSATFFFAGSTLADSTRSPATFPTAAAEEVAGFSALLCTFSPSADLLFRIISAEEAAGISVLFGTFSTSADLLFRIMSRASFKTFGARRWSFVLPSISSGIFLFSEIFFAGSFPFATPPTRSPTTFLPEGAETSGRFKRLSKISSSLFLTVVSSLTRPTVVSTLFSPCKSATFPGFADFFTIFIFFLGPTNKSAFTTS